MAKIKHITDKHGEVVYPISKEGAIYDDNGVLLSSKIATFITRLVDNLANYYLKSETYTKGEVDSMISAIQGFTCIVVPELPTASAETMGAIYLVPSEDPQTQNIKDEYITIRSGVEGSYTYSWEQIGSTAIDLSGYVTTEDLNEELAKYTTTANLTTLLAGKQDTIADLASIRSGASLGATAYQKPSSGIPASDIAAGVIPDISGKQDVIPDLSTIRSGAAAGATAYQKPSGGIPKTDLASGVQDSLDLADSAVQADPVGSVTPPVTPSDWATAEQVEELEAKVDSLPRGKDYGFFTSSSLLPSGATEEGFAYVGATEPYAIWQFDGTTWTDSGVTANAFTANPDDVGNAVDKYLEEHPTVTGTFLYEAKQKLVRLLEKVAFVDQHGQDYINELSAFLFLSPIDHIEAVYTQGSTVIYDFSEFSEVENGLVVTVFFSDGNSAVTTEYELSGTLEGGTSSLTVSVLDRVTGSTVTDTFDVTVVGSTKLYVRGDECSAVTGGWQVKGFNLTNGSPVTQKASDHLLIKFNTSNNQSSARSFSTINKINLSGKTKLVVRFKGYNNAGTGTLWCYWPATLSESTTQTGAYGSDYGSNRCSISPYDPAHVGSTFEGQIEASLGTSRTEAYASLNLNVYNTYSAGAYAEIYVVALI